MPEISLRAEQMPASPIRKLVPLADAARARGTKIYHLNIGQPDLPSPKEGLESLKHIDRKVLEYSPSDGYRSLREKLVTYYEQYQIKLSPEEIIVTTGGSEAVLFAFMSCLNPGDEIIVPEPAYANYMAFAISAGAVIRPVVASIENGFALPPIEEFEKLPEDEKKLRKPYPFNQRTYEAAPGIICDQDVAIPMRDGVILYADIFRPADSTAKVPVILANEYRPDELKAYTPGVPKGSISDLAKFEAADPEFWVPNGYAVANVDIRGIGYWADKIPDFSKVVVPAYVTAGWNHFHLQGSVNG